MSLTGQNRQSSDRAHVFPVYPKQWTFVSTLGTSVRGHKLTSPDGAHGPVRPEGAFRPSEPRRRGKGSAEQLIALVGQAGDLQRARPAVEVLPTPERQGFR